MSNISQKFTAIEQENKLLRQRNAELQQKLDCEYARGFKAGLNAIMRQNPSGCVCKFDEDDNLVEMCAAHKTILGDQLIALENKIKAER